MAVKSKKLSIREREIYFFAPSLKHFETRELKQSCSCYFKPVSITGSHCALKCDHCRGHILEDMYSTRNPNELLEAAEKWYLQGARGLLVSGGSDSDGVVPLKGFLGVIAEIRNRFGLKVLVHTSITDVMLARGLADAGVDAAMIDIIGSDETISDVCHLSKVSTKDYEASLANLADAGVPVAPHVVIGLDRGAINGELEALRLISRYPVASLVLVGIVPKPDTPFSGILPPSPMEMGEIFLAARELLPKTPILLGCERPWGEHKEATDAMALQAGLNGIAYPAEGTIALAKKMGLKPKISEMCCALLFEYQALTAS